MFFFEKKNQKTFASLGPCRSTSPSCRTCSGINDFIASTFPTPMPPGQKFFGSFFQKRTAS
jgi:hypothetical protein